jgi:hypothetical protein
MAAQRLPSCLQPCLQRRDLVVVALELFTTLLQVAANGPAARCRGLSSGKTTAAHAIKSLAFCRHMIT